MTAGHDHDRIELRGLRARGHHGVFAHERAEGQEFVVDAVLHVDTRAAAASDELADTVDYGALAQQLVQVIEGEPVNLVERLAARLTEVCLADDRVQRVELALHKPHAPIPCEFDDVVLRVVRDRPDRHRAVLSLGANLGDRAGALQRAVDLLARRSRVVAVSRIFQTSPVGGPDQPDYYNAVVVVETELGAAQLLAQAHDIEADAGRVRDVRWGPRTLDVDVVVYGDSHSADPVLTLPHPRARERAFVLAPWLDADPQARFPDGASVGDLLGALDPAQRSGVRPLDSPVLRIAGRSR